jgi:1-acyl-sn-glycerol-3-phosphate acyltransferase
LCEAACWVIFDFFLSRSLSLVRSTKRKKRNICDWRLSFPLSIKRRVSACVCVYKQCTYHRYVLHHHDDTKWKIGDILIVCNHRSEFWSFVCISYTIELDFCKRSLAGGPYWYMKRNLHVFVNNKTKDKMKQKRKERHIDVSWENS